MNYKNIKLDKSMYRDDGGFSNALEQLDPSRAYSGTELAGLDAYQRQLKRFDIKVSGANSDYVAKFFQTHDSATLFPEYIRRAVTNRIHGSNVVDEIIASKTNINSLDYRSISTDVAVQSDGISESQIKLNEHLVRLKKRGRLLSASYEAVKFQRIDLLSVVLGQIGAYISRAIMMDAVEVLLEDCDTFYADEKVNYSDVLALWSKFEDFEMNIILASPDMALNIFELKEFQNLDYKCLFATPFGAKLIKSSAVPKGRLIALDRRFAIEMVAAGDISVEYDKLIDAQLERAAITQIAGFSKIFPDAVKALQVKRRG